MKCLASYLTAWLRWHQWLLLPLHPLLARVQVGWFTQARPDRQPRAPPSGRSSSPGLSCSAVRVDCGRRGGCPHREKALYCSCGLTPWLIDLEPLYSFTTGFEIQHCTWGAMCVPSLSPFINLSLDLPLWPSRPPRPDFFVFLSPCTS